MEAELHYTDPETSHFSYNMAFAVSRGSIDAGRLRAELVGPATYEYTISR